MAKRPDSTAKKSKNRRKDPFRRFCTVMILLLLFWWFNNFTLKTVETSMTSDKISAPVRLTLLSDLHLSKATVGKKRIIRGIKDTEPDIVLILGDMYTRNPSDSTQNDAVGFMTSIVEEGFPVYFVPGDHDISDKYLADLRAGGVHVMDYKSETVNINGSSIRIMGIDNAYFTPTFDLHNEFALDAGAFNLLMAHIPNYPKYADFGADLTVCADTHGGMMRLPFAGPVFDSLSGKFFPKLRSTGTVYDKGWFDYTGGRMFITSGLGNYPAAIRLFNRPEIVTIELRSD